MPERAVISVEDISTRAVVATAETKGTLGGQSTLADALQGPYFTRWSCYRRTNLVWDQLELDDGRADVDNVNDLPQTTHDGARRILTGAAAVSAK